MTNALGLQRVGEALDSLRMHLDRVRRTLLPAPGRIEGTYARAPSDLRSDRRRRPGTRRRGDEGASRVRACRSSRISSRGIPPSSKASRNAARHRLLRAFSIEPPPRRDLRPPLGQRGEDRLRPMAGEGGGDVSAHLKAPVWALLIGARKVRSPPFRRQGHRIALSNIDAEPPIRRAPLLAPSSPYCAL